MSAGQGESEQPIPSPREERIANLKSAADIFKKENWQYFKEFFTSREERSQRSFSERAVITCALHEALPLLGGYVCDFWPFDFGVLFEETKEPEETNERNILLASPELIDFVRDQKKNIEHWYWVTENAETDSRNQKSDKKDKKKNIKSPRPSVQSPCSNTQSPDSSTQNAASGTQNPASDTQSPDSSTQNAASDTQNAASDTESAASDTENPGSNTQNAGSNTQSPDFSTQPQGKPHDVACWKLLCQLRTLRRSDWRSLWNGILNDTEIRGKRPAAQYVRHRRKQLLSALEHASSGANKICPWLIGFLAFEHMCIHKEEEERKRGTVVNDPFDGHTIDQELLGISSGRPSDSFQDSDDRLSNRKWFPFGQNRARPRAHFDTVELRPYLTEQEARHSDHPISFVKALSLYMHDQSVSPEKPLVQVAVEEWIEEQRTRMLHEGRLPDDPFAASSLILNLTAFSWPELVSQFLSHGDDQQLIESVARVRASLRNLYESFYRGIGQKAKSLVWHKDGDYFTVKDAQTNKLLHLATVVKLAETIGPDEMAELVTNVTKGVVREYYSDVYDYMIRILRFAREKRIPMNLDKSKQAIDPKWRKLLEKAPKLIRRLLTLGNRVLLVKMLKKAAFIANPHSRRFSGQKKRPLQELFELLPSLDHQFLLEICREEESSKPADPSQRPGEGGNSNAPDQSQRSGEAEISKPAEMEKSKKLKKEKLIRSLTPKLMALIPLVRSDAITVLDECDDEEMEFSIPLATGIEALLIDQILEESPMHFTSNVNDVWAQLTLEPEQKLDAGLLVNNEGYFKMRLALNHYVTRTLFRNDRPLTDEKTWSYADIDLDGDDFHQSVMASSAGSTFAQHAVGLATRRATVRARIALTNIDHMATRPRSPSKR